MALAKSLMPKLTRPPLNEKVIQKQILGYLRAHKIFCWQNDSIGVFDQTKGVFRKRAGGFFIKGVSDILGVLPDGRFLAIEVKTQATRHKASPDQNAFILEIKKNDGIAFVAWSLEQVDLNLKEYLERKK